MKKFLTISIALALSLSMVACGGSKPAASSSAASSSAPASSAPASSAPASSTAAPKPAPTPKPAPAPKSDLANPEYTPEQLAVAEKFAAMTDNFSALADKVNADENLLAIPELVDTMNLMIDAVNEDDALFADPNNLTPEVLANLEEGVVVGNNFVKEIEAMIKNYQGKNVVTVSVEIVNDTGVDIHGLAMSPANSAEWGGDMLGEPLVAGASGVTEMTFTEDSLVWDLLALDSEGTDLTFMGIDFTEAPMEGAKLVLSATEGGEYVAAFA